MGDIKVSISCLAYNHEPYIRQCLDGFLMQKCNFKFEVLIHDDASIDKTASIIKEYQAEYPDIIKPIYQTENQHSKGVKPTFAFNFPRCRGKYIALCEGDDYWTDPYKLQKQVAYMESNPECVLTGHDASIINQKGKMIKSSKLPDQFKRDASSQELKQGFFVLTLSMVFRKVPIFQNYPDESKNVLNGDTFLISMLGQYGSYHYIPEIQPAVYRVHEGGVWSSKSTIHKKYAQANTYFTLSKYYQRMKDEQTTLFFSQKAIRSMENWYYETIKNSSFLEKYNAYVEMWEFTEGKRCINFKALIKSFF